jgi:hypothetical protein
MAVLLTSGNKFYIMVGRGSTVEQKQYGQKSAALFHLNEMQTIEKSDHCPIAVGTFTFSQLKERKNLLEKLYFLR